MSEKFWDQIAENFDIEIFDTLENDQNKVILKFIDEFKSKESIAYDFGCGIGKYLPILSERFKRVYAIDISSRCLKIAKENNCHLSNIIFVKNDIAKAYLPNKKPHFAISINMLTMPSYEVRVSILKNIYQHMKKYSYFLLVLPSLESALYSHFRLLEWNSKSRLKHNPTPMRRFEVESQVISIPNGVLNIDGVPTKHYLKEEIEVQLTGIGFNIMSIDKVEYSWRTEFFRPPTWMKQPYPWDWLIFCQKH